MSEIHMKIRQLKKNREIHSVELIEYYNKVV